MLRVNKDLRARKLVALRKQVINNAVAADADRILNDSALGASASVVYTFLAQPDVPRNLTVTGAMAGASLTGNVTIYGTGYDGKEIDEVFALNNNNAITGNKAFRTVRKVALPARTTSGDTVDVGVGVKLGFQEVLPGNTVALVTCDGVYETTRPTVAFDVDEVEKNTISTNTAPDGSRDFVVYYFVHEEE